MVSIRQEREQQFLTGGSNVGTLSVDLLESAFTLLKSSLRDRRTLMFVTSDNHLSPHATGTVVMAVTALDAWINEVLVFLLWLQEDQRALGQKPLSEKYARLVRHFGAEPTQFDELRLLCQVRDEIVHFLPRWLGTSDGVPQWLEPLQKKGLFLERREPGNTLPDKLCSYKIAYWSWTTVASIVAEVVKAAGSTRAVAVDVLAGNFGWYTSVPAPAQLADYDAHYGINPTPAVDWSKVVAESVSSNNE